MIKTISQYARSARVLSFCCASILFGSGCMTLDTDIEDSVSIQQGIYGQALDCSGAECEAAHGLTIGIFENPPMLGVLSTFDHRFTSSNADGFYQLTAETAGTYHIAVLSQSDPPVVTAVQQVTVAEATLFRWDFSGSGDGSGDFFRPAEHRTPNP